MDFLRNLKKKTFLEILQKYNETDYKDSDDETPISLGDLLKSKIENGITNAEKKHPVIAKQLKNLMETIQTDPGMDKLKEIVARKAISKTPIVGQILWDLFDYYDEYQNAKLRAEERKLLAIIANSLIQLVNNVEDTKFIKEFSGKVNLELEENKVKEDDLKTHAEKARVVELLNSTEANNDAGPLGQDEIEDVIARIDPRPESGSDEKKEGEAGPEPEAGAEEELSGVDKLKAMKAERERRLEARKAAYSVEDATPRQKA